MYPKGAVFYNWVPAKFVNNLSEPIQKTKHVLLFVKENTAKLTYSAYPAFCTRNYQVISHRVMRYNFF